MRIVILALLLAGCQGAPFPLSDPGDTAADTTLNGIWDMVVPDGSDESGTVLIATFDDLQYYVEMVTQDDGPERMRAHASDFGNWTIVNISCIGCPAEERDWLFFGLERTADDLVLWPLADEHYEGALAGMSDQGALRAYFDQHMADGTLFKEPFRLRRRP